MPVNPLILSGISRDFAATTALCVKFGLAGKNHEWLSAELLDGLSRVNPDVIHGDFLACDAFDMTDSLSAINVPTLLICGTEDRMTPPAYSKFLAERIQEVSLVLLEGAGHYVMLEKVNAFNQTLVDFVHGLPR